MLTQAYSLRQLQLLNAEIWLAPQFMKFGACTIAKLFKICQYFLLTYIYIFVIPYLTVIFKSADI